MNTAAFKKAAPMRSTIAGPVLAGILGFSGHAHADGKLVFDQVCSKCHRTGVLNAPVAGNKAVWEPRVKAGREKLYESAINGKNDMPPKGGKDHLTDAEVKAAVDYLVSIAGM